MYMLILIKADKCAINLHSIQRYDPASI